MKKSIKSVKGGASIHTRPCKVTYCDKHNLRFDENPSNKNIRPEFSARNSSWIDPSAPNLVALDKQIRKDYFMCRGRHLPSRGPSKASPIKESVTRMPNGEITTDEIHKRITNRIEKEFGIRCIRRYNHRDEFCEETGTFNFHGHEVWDFYDYEQHRIVQLDRAQMRLWQDIVAEETGMPRGNRAYETHRKWISANEYKLRKQLETIEEKNQEIKAKEEEWDNVGMQVEQEFMIKEGLEKYNSSLAAENKSLQRQNLKLQAQNADKQDKILLGEKVELVIKTGLQKIFDHYLPSVRVEDFRILSEIKEAQNGEYEELKYMIHFTDASGNRKVLIVDKNDYFDKGKSALARKISYFFICLPQPQMGILKETQEAKISGPKF